MNYVLEKPNAVIEVTPQAPGLFEVVLHNDDFTPMEFVIEALREFFHLDEIVAKKITLDAHTKGEAVCGVYGKDVAESRIDTAVEYARKHDHPLRWSMQGV